MAPHPLMTHSTKRLVVSAHAGVRGEIGSNCRCNNVVGSVGKKEPAKSEMEKQPQTGRLKIKSRERERERDHLPSNKNTHTAKHDQEKNGAELLRFEGKDGKEHNEGTHEGSNNSRVASTKDIRHLSDNDTGRPASCRPSREQQSSWR